MVCVDVWDKGWLGSGLIKRIICESGVGVWIVRYRDTGNSRNLGRELCRSFPGLRSTSY